MTHKREKGEKKADSPMKTPSNETIRHVVINLVPYHINQITKKYPEEYFSNDNRDRHDRRPDYQRNDRDRNDRDHNRRDRYGHDDNTRDRYDKNRDRYENSRGHRNDRNDRRRDDRTDDNSRDRYDNNRLHRNDTWRDDRSRYGRGGNRGHGDRHHGGKRPWVKKPEIKYLPNYHVLDSDLAEIFKTDTETKKELDFKNIYELYYWMYYSFRQIVKEKMSKLSDDLKDEDILIQLSETNESIFQIMIKTGADDDMNAILAQGPIYLGKLPAKCACGNCPYFFPHKVPSTIVDKIVKKHYHEKTTLINSVIDKVNDAYDQFCKFEKEFDVESRP